MNIPSLQPTMLKSFDMPIMPALPWARRTRTERPVRDNRRHSADVGALFRSFAPPVEQEDPQKMSTDVTSSTEQTESKEINTPASPVPVARPRTSNQDSTTSAPVPPPDRRSRRFSLMRFRTASDPALGAKARAQEKVPPMPEQAAPPSIITTAPTFDLTTTFPPPPMPAAEFPPVIESRLTKSTPGSSSQVNLNSGVSTPSTTPVSSMRQRNGPSKMERDPNKSSRVTFDEPDRPSSSTAPGSPGHAPPSYDDHNQSLPLPAPRLSESSRSTASSADVAYTTTTTTHTVSTTTTFFRFRKKKDTPLFPLPPKVSTDARYSSEADVAMGRASEATSRGRPSMTRSSPGTPRASTTDHILMPPALGASALAAAALGIASGGQLVRSNSSASTHSVDPLTTPIPPRFRTRSSTMSSMDRAGDSGRSSLAGRNSLGGLFGMRARQGDPFSRTGSPQPYLGRSSTSQTNSLAVSRERLIIPERHDEDTPDRYLQRLEEAVSKSVIASILSKENDEFHIKVLKRYLATFNFVRDPMDISLRKFLMEVELPKETQQIDRVLQSFADRYHDCNPLIYSSSAQAYFIVFSLLILHTDVFNKNNKNKMTKADYVKNTRGEGVTNDVLEYFYDNISYTTFIKVEDDLDVNGEKIVMHRPKRKTGFGKPGNEPKRSREPVDPYAVIIDNKLDTLRPKLDDVLAIEDPYNYLGTAHTLNMPDLHRSFFRSAVLQIVSARSRPDAFLNPATAANPQDASPGVVEIKVTKIGVLWRKDTKKKKTRSPWQEWGALLTGSQLYFFRNVNWIKNLMDQFDRHVRAGNGGVPCVFSPPMLTFNPDSFMSTDDAVALLDRNYNKHKNAFIFVKHGGAQEYLLADTEFERNDWLAKLNYAAAFRTAQVRMRGVVGGHYDGQRNRSIRRMDNSNSGFRSIQTPSGEVSILSGRIDPQLAAEIASARRQVIDRKVSESEARLGEAHDTLEALIRNAHHLKMLTPLQQRTREAIIVSANDLAERLVASRMEIWKLKCHRDILLMDLDEERKVARNNLERNLSVTTPPGTPPRNGKSPSRSPSSIASTITPTQATVAASSSSRAELQRNTSTMSTVSHSTSRTAASHNSWELPPMSFELSRGNTTGSNHSPLIGHGDINGDAFNPIVTDAQQDSTSVSVNNPSEATSDDDASTMEKTSINDTSSIQGKGKGKDELIVSKTNSNDKEREKDKEASDRSKLRKSLQRTLAESTQGLSQRRSRKSREVSDHFPHLHPDHHHHGDEEPKDVETEGLPRSSMSFSIHGKKASVVTFGSEWQNMDSEARLARHRSSAQPRIVSGEEMPSTLGMQQMDRHEAASEGRVTVAVAPPVNRAEDGDDRPVEVGNSGELSGSELGILYTNDSSSSRLVVVNPDSPGSPDSPQAGEEADDEEELRTPRANTTMQFEIAKEEASELDSSVSDQIESSTADLQRGETIFADAVVVSTPNDTILTLTKVITPVLADDEEEITVPDTAQADEGVKE